MTNGNVIWSAGDGWHDGTPSTTSVDKGRLTTKVTCLGCDHLINPKYTLCPACAEDMGYGRRAR